MFLGSGILRSLPVKSHFNSILRLTQVCSMSDRLSLFQAIGLSEQKAKETLKNDGLSTKLETVVKQVGSLVCKNKSIFYLKQ